MRECMDEAGNKRSKSAAGALLVYCRSMVRSEGLRQDVEQCDTINCLRSSIELKSDEYDRSKTK